MRTSSATASWPWLGAVKLELSRDPAMDIITYIAEKSDVLQDVLAFSDLSDDEKALIRALHTRR